MLLKTKEWFWKSGLAAISFMILFCVSGCSDIPPEEISVDETIMETPAIKDSAGQNALEDLQNMQEGDERIIDIYLEGYKKAVRENKTADLEIIRSIINQIGEIGYPAVDSRNQIDMTQAEQVVQFCEKVKAQEEAVITIVEIGYWNGFVKYFLRTKDGSVDVVRSYYKYENGNVYREVTESYQAEHWNDTQEGYLMFSGVWFSEEQYVLTVSQAEEYTALRIQPLDETCRELNRKYLLPISYRQNNMFLVDWSEEDFGDLNFYDMYDILYPKINAKPVPYTADDNLGVGAVYQIPKEEFESVIMTCFNVDSETLQSKTTYHAEDLTYEYRPRGFYEVEYPEYPYPEVVGYTQNSDGTMTLTVNVVFPYVGDSKVYSHEGVVRPLGNGGAQYVSNRIIPSEGNHEETWYTPRLTTEEWEKLYTEKQEVTEKVCKSPMEMGNSKVLISDAEKEQLQSKVLAAAESVSKIYKDVAIADAPGYSSGVSDFTSEQRKAVVEELGKMGLVSVEEDTNMQNHEAIENFYTEYLNGHDSMVTVFEVQRDGLIGAVTFIYRKDKLQTYYIEVSWKEGGVPEIQETSVSDVAEIKLTEKGYFIYTYETVIAHADLREYWRIEPLSDDCRELTEKYIQGLSYVNYNMLVVNWDSSNVEDILMPCMFEDIYRIYTGKNLKTENGKIPAEEYEKIMTTYFPVSVEQLREYCGYDEGSNSYEYEMIYARQYPPFGEVIDYNVSSATMENPDGTITLIVDGVWPDYNSDLAFTNQIVVQPFEDGTFRYLSNSIEQKELEVPSIASTY